MTGNRLKGIEGIVQVELHGRALLPVGAEEQVVVVRDDEPTSIVAYFLSTRWALEFWLRHMACHNE